LKTHDKLGQRLGLILTKLNSGERLHIEELATEFNVSTRTIQRDLNQRLAYLPIEHSGKNYWLISSSLGKRSNRDIRNFARLLGIENLFPYLDDMLLTNLLDSNQRAPYIVKGMSYEDSSHFVNEFRLLEKAVSLISFVSFNYKNKSYTTVRPYRLVNYKGIWYLAAVHDFKLKSFVVSQINQPNISYSQFESDPAIDDEIDTNETIWYGANVIEVILKVSPIIANYFRRRSLLPCQAIVHELEDGGLLLSSRIQHPTQIIPLIKYWIPDIEVISPASIKNKIILDLKKTLDKTTQLEKF
jgi:predicted DNA-binding transcriptional regulator YafY